MAGTVSPYVPAALHIWLMTPFTEGTLLTHKNALRITIDLLRPISFSSFLIKIGESINILCGTKIVYYWVSMVSDTK